MKGCGASPHPLKAARPGTRDSVSRCSAMLHTASHRLAERNRYVALRSLFMSGLDAPVSPCLQFRLRRFTPSLPSPSVSSSLPAPTCYASTSGSDCPPPARRTRAKVRASVHYSQDSARAGRTVIHRISVRVSGRLPRPTALPPMPFVSGHSHGYRRSCIRPQTAQAI